MYKLIRTKRKTIALYITARGLEVRAPLSAPVKEIEQFVQSKSRWIEKHLSKMAKSRGGREGFLPGYGDSISFQGQNCPILASAATDARISGKIYGHYKDGAFHITGGLSPDEIQRVLSDVLAREARLYIPKRVAHYQMKMGLVPEGVRITRAFRRWGSCSGRRRLNFAWMLMMADEQAIDSVVVHELAHMVHPNHSPVFYGLVRSVFPEYDASRRRLNALGERIEAEGWREGWREVT